MRYPHCGRETPRRWWALVLLAWTLVMVVIATLPAYQVVQRGRVVVPLGQRAAAARRGAGSRTPATTTPTPDLTVLANLAMACASGRPPVQPGVVVSGTNPRVQAAPPDEVALTFDDGPSPYSSPPILAYLEQTDTPATFMVEGQYVQLWPYLVQREWRDGFAIGIHTWDHPNMTTLTPAERQFQLAATLKALHQALGQNACIWFWRPPYGAYNSAVLRTAASLGLTTVKWDVDPQDWSRPGTRTIVNRVLAQVHPGVIILLHDGPALRDQTRDALPGILAGLRARGLTPVTLPKLMMDGHYLRSPASGGVKAPAFRGVAHRSAAADRHRAG